MSASISNFPSLTPLRLRANLRISGDLPESLCPSKKGVLRRRLREEEEHNYEYGRTHPKKYPKEPIVS
jgi:hypothetical protein